MKHFGNTVVVWDFHARKPIQTLEVPGAPLEIRWALQPRHNYAFTTTALTSKIWLVEQKDDGSFAARAVADIADPKQTPLPVDISLSADDRFLFVDTFMDGSCRVYDVSEPSTPKLVHTEKIGSQVNMVSQTWDGKRLYFTASLRANWDKKADDEQFLKPTLGRPKLLRRSRSIKKKPSAAAPMRWAKQVHAADLRACGLRPDRFPVSPPDARKPPCAGTLVARRARALGSMPVFPARVPHPSGSHTLPVITVDDHRPLAPADRGRRFSLTGACLRCRPHLTSRVEAIGCPVSHAVLHASTARSPTTRARKARDAQTLSFDPVAYAGAMPAMEAPRSSTDWRFVTNGGAELQRVLQDFDQLPPKLRYGTVRSALPPRPGLRRRKHRVRAIYTPGFSTGAGAERPEDPSCRPLDRDGWRCCCAACSTSRRRSACRPRRGRSAPCRTRTRSRRRRAPSGRRARCRPPSHR